MKNKIKRIKLSEFFDPRRELKPFLLGAFLSRIVEEEIDGIDYFYAYSSFRTSKIMYYHDYNFYGLANNLVEKFNKKSGFCNWEIKRITDTHMVLVFYVINDLNFSRDTFCKALITKIKESKWATETDDLNNEKRDFIRGFIELRGSVDTSLNYIAQDYFYKNRYELQKCLLLPEHLGIPINYMNFNARELQPEYVSGKKRRNTQFRLNLKYYAKKIGFINDYKAEIFSRCHKNYKRYIDDDCIFFNLDLPYKDYDISFLNYFNFYTYYMYGNKLKTSSIKLFREKLGFNEKTNMTKENRNKLLERTFFEVEPKECCVCGIKNTSTNPKTGEENFQIHHVISLCNDDELENVDNLVLVCPNCHDMLKKGHAEKEQQKNAIRVILDKKPNVRIFAEEYLEINDIDDLVERIWELLG